VTFPSVNNAQPSSSSVPAHLLNEIKAIATAEQDLVILAQHLSKRKGEILAQLAQHEQRVRQPLQPQQEWQSSKPHVIKPQADDADVAVDDSITTGDSSPAQSQAGDSPARGDSRSSSPTLQQRGLDGLHLLSAISAGLPA